MNKIFPQTLNYTKQCYTIVTQNNEEYFIEGYFQHLFLPNQIADLKSCMKLSLPSRTLTDSSDTKKIKEQRFSIATLH